MVVLKTMMMIVMMMMMMPMRRATNVSYANEKGKVILAKVTK